MADENEKPYSISVEEHDPYLRVVVSGGKLTPEIALAYWNDIIAECKSRGYSKILLDHDFVEMLSMSEMLQVIGPVIEMLRGRILAFYDRYGHYEIPEAGKKIMRSRDVKMQIFRDLGQAERWLLAN